MPAPLTGLVAPHIGAGPPNINTPGPGIRPQPNLLAGGMPRAPQYGYSFAGGKDPGAPQMGGGADAALMERIARTRFAQMMSQQQMGNNFNARNGTGGDRGFGRSPQAQWRNQMYDASIYGMNPQTGQIMRPGAPPMMMR